MQTGKETKGQHEVEETTGESEGTTGKGGWKGLFACNVIQFKAAKRT